MVTPNEIQHIAAQRSVEQQRDQEIRKFCELLRLVWAEDPNYTFCELINLVAFDLGDVDTDKLDKNDREAFKLIKDLYHNGDIHHGGEDGLECDTGLEIGPFTPEHPT